MFKQFSTIGMAILIILAFSPGIDAQESGTIQATATVLPALSVTGQNNLIFGTVFPGTDKSVDKADAGFAGALHIQGNNNAEVMLTFVLPGNLLTADSVSSMLIDFNSTDASYDNEGGGGQSSPAGTIDPRAPNALDLGPTGQMDIWIGGMVQPVITQTGGGYSADITLSVVYTGN